MSDKYYSPEIEEFHVGFEYEYRKSEHHDFDEVACDLEVDPIDKLRDDIKNNLIRVKYLDRKDIEECGFEDTNDQGMAHNNGYLFTKECGVFSKSLITLRFWENSKRVSIKRVNAYLFDGIIKNKSELKKILKQVAIINQRKNEKRGRKVE